MKSKTLFGVAWMATAFLFAALDPACATPVPWRGSMVHVAVEGKDLKEVLRDFTASQRVATSIAENVQGTVTGRFDLTPQRFLDTLASSFGFVWFYDGNLLSITSANDSTRQVIKLDHASTDDLRSVLRTLNIEDARFRIVYDGGSGTLLVNGPQPYVQVVADVARKLDDSVGRRGGSVIRVFKLKHAWAADHKVQINGETVTLPGVAAVLSNMYHPRDRQLGTVSQTAASSNMRRLPPMRDVNGSVSGGGQQLMPPLPPTMPTGQGTSIGGLIGTLSAQNIASGGDFGYRNASAGLDAIASNSEMALPVMQADPATNSVLVNDTPQRIDQYASVIDQLDVRPKLIEIEAHIIEINDDLLTQIGIDWRAHNSHLDFQTGSGTYQQNNYAAGSINPNFGTSTLADGITAVASTPVGGSITAVLGDAGRYLMARVNALQTSSRAKIEASPKVATLDNVEAVMDNKTSFYVRVSGYTSADLYSVSTGVSLRVLPMVVQEEGKTRIKLEVHIEDGQLTGQQVDNIPVITNSEINTQAFVGQGESLLIAGYSVSDNANGMTGVPGLSKIPFIGALFRYKNNQSSRMERVFLLTPRVLNL